MHGASLGPPSCSLVSEVYRAWLVLSCITSVLAASCTHTRTVDVHQQELRKLPPVWPSAYKVKFKFSVPYLEQYQSQPLVYDMQFWRNTALGLQRILRDNSETWVEHAAQDVRWYETPANGSAMDCLCERISDGGGPSLTGAISGQSGKGSADSHGQLYQSAPDRKALTPSRKATAGDLTRQGVNTTVMSEGQPNTAADRVQASFEELLSPALAPITTPKWRFEKCTHVTTVAGDVVATNVWLLSMVQNRGYGDVTTDYRMHVTDSGIPVKMDMWGENWFSGGHWDHYIADFYEFQADPVFPVGVFDMPVTCAGCIPTPPDLTSFMGGHHLTQRLHQATHGMIPSKYHGGDKEYDAHVHAFGRAHAHRAEYEVRQAHFHRNSDLINAHNSADSREFTMEMNHFGDWSDEEFRTLLRTTQRVRPSDQATGVAPEVHNVTWPLHMLPPTIDWRGSGADSVIKDQAMCGSCWAFSSIAPMETAYYRQYGEAKLLSEQFLMDCSWGNGNTGCNGGFQEKAFDFAVQAQGIPSNDVYPYAGVNMPCKPDVPLAASIAAFVNVQPYSPEHLKEALLTKGPMTVSLDADNPAFKFYRQGLFYASDCKTQPADELDHAVMISGYGRDSQTGRKYWLLKNMWSTWWGEQGYMRMDMDRNDCGVTALPEYVRLDVEATDLLRAG